MMRRVRRPTGHEALLKRLASDEGPFSTLAEVLTFAAAVGYSEGRREAFTASGEQIDFDIFERLGADRLIDMLAATVNEDVAILGPSQADERLTIFEEFANGGLSVLAGTLEDARGDLDRLLTLVLTRKDSSESTQGGAVDFDAVVSELTR
jgi:dnd system-associated protein 4